MCLTTINFKIICLMIIFSIHNSLLNCFTNARIIRSSPPTPLALSAYDVSIRALTNESVLLFRTGDFDDFFKEAQSASIKFLYSNPGVVSSIPNINLIDLNEPTNFTNSSIVLVALTAGREVITSQLITTPQLNLTLPTIFLRVTAYKSTILLILAQITGWIYFLAWTGSFYPQIYLNWKRQSVRGLSFDFVYLNVTGFFVYSIYNIGLYFVPFIQDEYLDKFPTGEIPVQLNDVIFSVHALLITLVTFTQCQIYERGSQTVSTAGKAILGCIYIFLIVMLIVALGDSSISWLAFLTVCSYVKLFITLIKYVPQAYLNYSRKSTSGWCIGNVLLDVIGGIFSILQMLINGYNYNDWWSILGDFTKFGLGLFSVTFDIIFMIQHYLLYRNHESYEPIEGSNDGESIDPYDDIVTSTQVQNEEEIENSINSREINT